MEESWDVCLAHVRRLTEAMGVVIAQGAASGEFVVTDIPLAALCTCHALVGFFHPQMIAQARDKPGPSIDQMIGFVLAALGSHQKN
jgi:hypothetical protein